MEIQYEITLVARAVSGCPLNLIGHGTLLIANDDGSVDYPDGHGGMARASFELVEQWMRKRWIATHVGQ